MRITRSLSLLAIFLFLTARPGAAQAPPGFLEEFDGQFNASASKLVALAEAMPAEALDWAPMEGVASVAEVYMHIARYNYFYPETAMGIPSPMGRAEYDSWEDGVRDKEQLLEILSASMDHVRQVAEHTSSSDLNEHLGQSIAYARMNGVVPPWSM